MRETASNNYTHAYEGAELAYCSEATEWDHYGQPGTGWGTCPHHLDEDGCPAIVRTIL